MIQNIMRMNDEGGGFLIFDKTENKKYRHELKYICTAAQLPGWLPTAIWLHPLWGSSLPQKSYRFLAKFVSYSYYNTAFFPGQRKKDKEFRRKRQGFFVTPQDIVFLCPPGNYWPSQIVQWL